MDYQMNKKGQIAIFVIIALVLVVGIALFFVARATNPSAPGREIDPEGFMEACVKDAVNDVTSIMISQGGKIAPVDFIVYDDIKVNYLCKNVNYYDPCINQYPAFVKFLKQELKNNIQNKIQSCFGLMEREFKNRGYEVTRGSNIITNVELKPELVEVRIEGQMSFEKNGAIQRFTSFDTLISNPLFDLGYVAQEIVSQEARFCYFSNDGFTILYPKFDIRKNTLSEGTRIYSIEHTETGKIMNIAIRGCAIPQGLL